MISYPKTFEPNVLTPGLPSVLGTAVATCSLLSMTVPLSPIASIIYHGSTATLLVAPNQAESERAMRLRAQWMQQMGLSPEEIEEYCDASRYPGTVNEEAVSLQAACDLSGRETR